MRKLLKGLALLPPLALGLMGAAVGLAGALLIVTGDELWRLLAGALLHIGATVIAVLAARVRNGAPLAPVARDIVLLTALLMPGVGPVLAWSMLRKDRGRKVENAHEVVERYLEYVKPRIPEYERTLFTGDFDKDLARKLDAVSYREVLSQGNMDQKRSALSRLADLGEPHHLALIRRCLEDPETEIRLYAYGELERLIKGHETAVAAARRGMDENPEDVDARMQLARAHFALATSGLLDPATAGFHLRVSAEQAIEAHRLKSETLDAVLLEALAYANMGHLEKASERLDRLPTEQRETPEVSRVRGEVAYRARDFAQARVEAGRLILAEEELPDYLKALCVTAEEPRPEEEEEEEGDGDGEDEGDADDAEVTA